MSQTPQKIAVIGIGDDGLDAVSPSVRQRILEAELVLGSDRALKLLPEGRQAEQQVLSGDLDELASQLESVGGRRAVVLIFGDPMFYGLARYVTEKIGKDRFEVAPHVSSMQLAFARVMESWDEAYLTNLANHPLDKVVERIRTAQKAGLFTSPEQPPNAVAQALLDKGIDYFHAYVCENLGARDERVTRGSLEEIAAQSFAPLNVMILVRQADAPDRPRDAIGRRLFGNPDEAFLQSKPKQGLATSAEVRALALAQMDIAPGSIVWDIGAGSGSVSVEAAQLARDGAAYAVEMDPEDHGLIKQNADRFGVTNLMAILGKAPEALADLPDPDAVFVAGGGREVARICSAAYERLRPGGRLVVNLIAINNLAELYEQMGAASHDCRVMMVNIAEGADQLGRLSFESLKPSFLLSVIKP
ncbi:Precorrin-6Y C(5,15)-methyltransferase [decarboxylating] [Posidoniimonas corsicana]|uniref:Precorrin-6Y C(5,15)-methyltransferase [decarboxylating] n=1 Tax=Posidoniimonas corsicana TaxID=1938618 RepID=A0A5C5VEV0_9BACT|nr:precorrin-6y C5,15-methyltransferase (decarboxylating) subunit CbiE [Posidoniimonas corsicana]TWT36235.1 Precorrin-6Y C(5,15)-methyltransferase [decarboxylating] [Posidoniimonas corsicana]